MTTTKASGIVYFSFSADIFKYTHHTQVRTLQENEENHNKK